MIEIGRPVVVSVIATLVALLSGGVNAHAGFCGDDVDGVRVPCDCGDVVAGDTTLRPDDPIANRRCPMDGLIVRAGGHTESVHLDLGGIAIVGSHRGTGLLIERGGSDGAVVTGGAGERRAEIVGFGTGVHCPSGSALRRLERIHVKGSRHDGYKIRQSGAFLVDLGSSDNGGDGFRLSGSGGRMIRGRTERNEGVGIRSSTPNFVLDVEAEGNRGHGIVSRGARTDLSTARAHDNGRHGIVARSSRQVTSGAVAERNAHADLRVEAGEAGR